MALIVEDGSGVVGADSYIAHAEFLTFAEGANFAVSADALINEGWLRRAAFAMGQMRWKGAPVSSGQALSWPRTGVYVDGELLPSTVIPRNIVYGQAMLAIELYAEDLAKDQPGGGAAITEHSVTVDAIEEAKKFDLASRNSGSLLAPAAKASSRAQFADYLVRRGLLIPADRA